MQQQAQQSECILVVDGDVLVRHAIADYLRGCGYTVIEAATTDEAVTVINDGTLPLEAVLCDAEAPGTRNPFQLRAWALQQRCEVEVTLAGNIEAAADKAAELCEDGPHLARPYDPQSVVEYIRRLIGGAEAAKQA